MVKVELSLREARALLRAVSAAGRMLYDPRAGGIAEQSEVYRALYDVERSVKNAVAEYSECRSRDWCAGYRLVCRWGDEPLPAPFGSVFGKAVA